MVFKIIEQLGEENSFDNGLQTREAAALACINHAHANVICPLLKELRIRKALHELRFAFCM